MSTVRICNVCGQPEVDTRSSACPDCNRLRHWLSKWSEFPIGTLVVGDEKENEKL